MKMLASAALLLIAIAGVATAQGDASPTDPTSSPPEVVSSATTSPPPITDESSIIGLDDCRENKCNTNFDNCVKHNAAETGVAGTCSEALDCFRACDGEVSKPNELQCERNCEVAMNSIAKLLMEDLATCSASQCTTEETRKRCQGWDEQTTCEENDGCFFTLSRCSHIDSVAPTFQNCPLDYDVPTRKGAASTELHWVPIGALDNGEAATVTQVSPHGSGDNFEVGTTVVTYVATDDADPPNENTCTFSVHVRDPWEPELQYCPSGWEVVVTVTPSQTILGLDGRYYAIATWPQPEATDNVGAEWSYTSDYKVYNNDELVALQADTAASPLPVDLENAVTKAWAFAPTAATEAGGPLKNGGVFPIENGITTSIVYDISDAAGNRVQCSLTVAMKPTHISFYNLQLSAVPRAPSDAADDWVESNVLAHYQAFVSAEACAEKCHSIAQTSAAAAAEEGADGSVRTCNAFLASRDGLNQCILLDLSGEGTRGNEFEFDANWDRYFLQAKSTLECAALDAIDACLATLPTELDAFVAAFDAAAEDVSTTRSDCSAAVNAAYTCVSGAFDEIGCADEWVNKVVEARNANDLRTCESTEAPEVGQPASLRTSCNDEDLFDSAEACAYECCERDYSGAESRCTVLTNDGTVAEAGDERTVACMAEAWSIREQCTERCLRARPFSAERSIAAVLASAEPVDSGNLHGDALLVDATAGSPPSGFVDVEVTLSFEHELGANWSAVESATSRAAVIASCAEVYGMSSDGAGLEFSSAAGGASVIRVVERQPVTNANSVSKFGDASASKFNIASPEDAASLPATVPFACASIAGRSGDYLAVLQTAVDAEASPCSEHATQLEDVARQCMPSDARPTESYECLLNATSKGHDILTNSATDDCTVRKDALVAALSRFAPGFPISFTCERANGKSVLRVGDCVDTAALLARLTSSSAAGGFAECQTQDTRSLAQSIFDDFQAGVASSGSNSMHFPPLAAAGHQESLVRRLSGRIPAEFNAADNKGLFFASMRMEWSSSDIEEASVTTAAPAVYYDFDALTEDGGAVTLGGGGNATAADGTDAADNLASNLDASTGAGSNNDRDAVNSEAGLSTGVLAFAIVVPVFIIAILIYVAVQHKKHRKVHVVPTGLSFKQPAPMQSLPNRGIPNYKDRTMQDVRSNALSSMPTANGASDRFLPKRLSSAGTRLPPMPKSHDPFGAAKTKADGPDPFGDFN